MLSTTRLLSALLALAVSVPPLPAADLTKIDRTIKKQPAYKTKPGYCLLVFGPEAKTRVWVVLDGDVLYIDRNGNGDLTEKGNRFQVSRGFWRDLWPQKFEVRSGTEEGGKATPAYSGELEFRERPYGLEVTVSVRGKTRQEAELPFRTQPQDAPIVHFDGPLTFEILDKKLVRGDTPGDFRAIIGTAGLGELTFASSAHEDVPKQVHPVAEIEFPSRERGAKPIRMRLVLDHRCCKIIFWGSLRVPDEAANGKAKVTISFPGWTEGRVIPVTRVVPVVDPEPVGKGPGTGQGQD